MKKLVFVFILIFNTLLAQKNNILERLSVLKNNEKTWYSIDDYTITSQTFSEIFDEKGLKKVLRKHSLKNR